MRRIWRRAAHTRPASLFSILLSSTTISTIALSAGTASGQNWGPYIFGGGGGVLSGEFADRQDGYLGEVGVFMPLFRTEDALAYGDLRTRFEDGAQTYGAGIGYRQQMGDGLILGAAVGYERYQSPRGLDHERLYLTGEAMGAGWDARVNGYIPLSGEARTADAETLFDPDPAPDVGQVVVGYDFEGALYGVELWGGGRLVDAVDGELWGHAGAYYYERDKFDPLEGVGGRLEWRVVDMLPGFAGSSLTASLEARWDEERTLTGRALVNLVVPFQDDASGPGVDADLNRRFSEIAPRDTFVVGERAGTDGDIAPVYFDGGMPVMNLYYVNEGGIGAKDGSSPENAADFDAKVRHVPVGGDPFVLPDNTLLVVLDNGGTIFPDHGVFEASHVHAVAGSSSIDLLGGFGDGFTFTAPGGRPRLERTLSGPLLSFSGTDQSWTGGTMVSSGTAFHIGNAEQVRIADSVIDLTDTAFKMQGVLVLNSKNVELQDLSIAMRTSEAGGYGIQVESSEDTHISNISIDITVPDDAASDYWATGLRIAQSKNAIVDTLDVDGGGAMATGRTRGIQVIDSSVTSVGTDIRNVRITNVSDFGIIVSSFKIFVELKGVVVSNTGNTGISIGAGDSVLDNVHVSFAGLNKTQAVGIITVDAIIRNSSVSDIGLGAGQHGIGIDNSSTFDLNNVTVTRIGGSDTAAGIGILQNGVLTRFTDVVVSAVHGTGIFLDRVDGIKLDGVTIIDHQAHELSAGALVFNDVDGRRTNPDYDGTIRDLTIAFAGEPTANADAVAVYIQDSEDIIIDGFTIDANGGSGIRTKALGPGFPTLENDRLKFIDGVISNVGQADGVQTGIDILGFAQSLRIDGVRIDPSATSEGDFGIRFKADAQVTLTGTDIGAFETGISIDKFGTHGMSFQTGSTGNTAAGPNPCIRQPGTTTSTTRLELNGMQPAVCP